MSHPLLCWDICIEGLQRRMYLAEDLKIIKKIIRESNWHEPLVSLDNSLVWENKVIVITDSKLNIIHATENLFAMNGYKQSEVKNSMINWKYSSPRNFCGMKELVELSYS